MDNAYKSGEWNAICDSCGRKFKSSQLRKRWDGFVVCEQDWEPQHPIDFLKARQETPAPPWTRPEQADVSITVDYIDESTGVQETTVPSGTFDGSF